MRTIELRAIPDFPVYKAGPGQPRQVVFGDEPYDPATMEEQSCSYRRCLIDLLRLPKNGQEGIGDEEEEICSLLIAQLKVLEDGQTWEIADEHYINYVKPKIAVCRVPYIGSPLLGFKQYIASLGAKAGEPSNPATEDSTEPLVFAKKRK